MIGTGAVQTAQIADGSITDAKIVSLTATKITSGTIDTGQVTVQGANGKLRISGNRLQVFDNQQTPVERVSLGDVNGDGTVYGLRVRSADGATVLYDHNGVYSAGITDGAITNPKISSGAVDNRVIAANAITADKIVAGTITGDKIASNTITANNIAANTITAGSAIIADGAITTAKIGDGSITTVKIEDASITSAKIGAAQVDTVNIKDGSITNAKISDLSADKITSGVIDSSIVNVGNDKIELNGYTGNINLKRDDKTLGVTLGRYNYDTGVSDATFSRSSIAYKQDGTQVVTNTPRFETGKFGKAIMVEEGTQNLLKNASFEVYTGTTGVADGWSNWVKTGVTAVYSIDTTIYRSSGLKSQKIEITANSSGTTGGQCSLYQDVAVGASVNITHSIYYQISGVDVKIGVAGTAFDSTGAVISTFMSTTSPTGNTSGWQRLYVSGVTPANTAKVRFDISFQVNVANALGTIWIDDAQLEQKSYPTSIIFANDTTTQATRSAETMTIPTTGVLNPQEGTVECWCVLPNIPRDGDILVGTDSGWGGRIWLPFKSAGIPRISIYTSNINSDVLIYDVPSQYLNTWVYLVVTWDGQTKKLYLNGQMVASKSYTGTFNITTSSFMIGKSLNSLIDDLRISRRARTDAEIAAAYASNTPLIADEYTTYKLEFDGSLNKISSNYGLKVLDGYIDASSITTGTLDASKVNVVNLNASNITTGTLKSITIDSVTGVYSGDIKTANLFIDGQGGQNDGLGMGAITVKVPNSVGTSTMYTIGASRLGSGDDFEVYLGFTDRIGGTVTSLTQVKIDAGMLYTTGHIHSLEYIEADGDYYLASGKQITSKYNNGPILKDHANGNITLNAAGGSLYLGYYNTGVIYNQVKTFMPNGSGIKGNNTGNANVSYFAFYESDGATRQGWIGAGSSSNSDIYLSADVGSVRLNAYNSIVYFGSTSVDYGGGNARWRRDASNYIYQDGSQVVFYIGGEAKHTFRSDGTKSGGSIVIDGKNYGMSPIDSPRTLISDLMQGINVSTTGTKVYLDSVFYKTINGYSLFFNKNGIEIVEQAPDYFVIKSTDVDKVVDVFIIGTRVGEEGKYYYNLDIIDGGVSS
ncbi:LamG domain-containing protein [Tepidibacillus fermentans]|uniref:Concanavalin A-like lectin/glucanase superfamily protein n=1 Tax=Tepidibacillus fermentans TaxID=1281767 RepID=A0A4R3KB71_9BACI|nr:LamG domain-containing protein [Tepidibacillus fermentans]TCS80386.1 concanavalin A-like lectin/glucanase superfamily protein [Tepidibacillus fermentans]